jgi:hypothetical protein
VKLRYDGKHVPPQLNTVCILNQTLTILKGNPDPTFRASPAARHLAQPPSGSTRHAEPAKIGKSLRGHAQKSFSIKETIFASFLSLLAEDDPFHATTLRRGGILPYTPRPP